MQHHEPESFRAEPPTVLFLAGPPSSFWRKLGRAFAAAGWRVLKVNFSPAEALFWRSADATRFSGGLDAWRRWLSAYIAKQKPQRLFLYADRQPYHREAIAIAEVAGVAVTVFENGYLRPDWLTVENGGMGRYSHFPREPDRIRDIARRAPAPDLEIAHVHPFFAEAWREVTYHLANGLTPRFLWRHDHGRYYHPVRDYLAWALRLIGEPARSRRAGAAAEALIAEAEAGAAAYFFVPLQLQSDYAIQDNSYYRHISQMIAEVVASFAAHAGPAARLVFKSHPHDNGIEPWPRIIRREAARAGLGDRVAYLAGGPFGRLLGACVGCVVINSTSGLHAIREGKPVIALGDAVYDVAGLAHQSGLDSFWRAPEPVDMALAADFVTALAARTQVKGSFFEPAGRARAVRMVVERLGAAPVAAVEAL